MFCLFSTTSISVVVPVYNEEEIIEECLLSLVPQSYRPREIIVVNDGSTDKTEAIVRRIASEYPVIRVITIAHSGRSTARNTGLKTAEGELVFFAESDAKYHPEYLQTAVNHSRSPEIGGLLMGGEVWEDDTFISRCMQTEVRMRNNDLRMNIDTPTSAWIYRRSLLLELGGFDESLEAGEDTDLGMRVLKAGFSIKWIDGIYWWFKCPSSIGDLLSRSFWFGREKAKGFFRKYPDMFPWKNILFGVLLMFLLIFSSFNASLLSFFLFFLGGFLCVRTFFVWQRGKGVAEAKYLIALAFLGILRFFAFVVGLFTADVRTPSSSG